MFRQIVWEATNTGVRMASLRAENKNQELANMKQGY
jgi:hypothetical protein